MTEQRIREIAREAGFSIIDSPVWHELAKRFIEQLLQELDKENKHVR